MFKKTHIAIIPLLFLFTCVSLQGCGTSDNNTNMTSQYNVPNANITWVIDILKKVPKENGFCVCVNDDLGRKDSDFEELIREQTDYYSYLEFIGINRGGVSKSCVSDELIFKVHIDPSEIRSRLQSSGYEKVDSFSIEVWNKEYTSIIITDDIVIRVFEEQVANWEEAITNPDKALYNSDFQDVINRLPHGLLVMFDENSVIGSRTYKGVLASGCSVQKKAPKSLEYTLIYKFSSIIQAQKGLDELSISLDSDTKLNWENSHIYQDEEFVIITASWPISAIRSP